MTYQAKYTDDERVQKSLDTLTDLMGMPSDELGDREYDKRAAAEEILRHYREQRAFKEGIKVIVEMSGHVPVRPVERPAGRPISDSPQA